MTTLMPKPETRRVSLGSVHCPMCTHTVPATILIDRRSAMAKPGQKCPRCESVLDAAYVLQLDRAA